MIPTNTQVDNRRFSKFLYWQGWALVDIANYLNVNARTIQSWKIRDGWDNTPVIKRIQGVAECRLIQLINKDGKNGTDFKEIDLLGRQMERYTRINKFQEPSGNEADLNPNLSNRRKGKKFKNHIPDDEIEKLRTSFFDSLFKYQLNWWQQRNNRTRILLKSRQIGATWYFAREAIIDALETGKNKIFLSASKNQAFVFKHYILAFVRQVTGIELKGGDVIVLENGAELYFLGTSSRTAQSYHGDLYIDEFFWIPDFETLNKVASGMAAHKHWKKTYFSTPSSMSHTAYPFWTGKAYTDRYNEKLDVTHDSLRAGKLMPDKIYRQIVDVYDAQAGGCELFDIDELKNFEYSEDQFNNLFMCQFIDDTESIFSFATMMSCTVDALESWSDWKPHTTRPLGNKEVWIGYDPSVRADGAGLVIIAPPTVAGGKFRVIESIVLKGLDFFEQSQKIKEMITRYHVTKIAMDCSGIGDAVYQQVVEFFPSVKPLYYNIELKTQLVLKAQHVIKHRRLEMDAGEKTLIQAFMTVKKQLTPSGKQVTYSSGRTEEYGHADVAWATMNALLFEPLGKDTTESVGFMEFS